MCSRTKGFIEHNMQPLKLTRVSMGVPHFLSFFIQPQQRIIIILSGLLMGLIPNVSKQTNKLATEENQLSHR